MSTYVESEKMELKERYSDTIAKEIVSFLNADGGMLVVGVKDNGTIIGVSKLDETLRKISDTITAQIEPNPQDEITTEVKFEAENAIIILNISKGNKNIYCQKKYGFSSSGCTIRIGTTCKEMTPAQIKIRYEQNFFNNEYMLKKISSKYDLSFQELKIYYTEKKYHIHNDISFEKNLHLRTKNGEYNLLGELLADTNNIPLIFVKFKGRNKSTISERTDFGYRCLLTAYTKIKDRLIAENICLSNTTVRPRIDTYLYDINCVNEALINALIHNDWTITEPQISMFDNRIEILSHGGLPNRMTKEEFFEGISKPRNNTLMGIFLSMGLVEHTGHGIPTIVEKYGKDVFEIKDTYIRCVIPFNENVMANRNGGINVGIDTSIDVGLKPSEKKVLSVILENPAASAVKMAEMTGMSTRTAERALSHLQELGFVERIGSRRVGRWRVMR